MWKWFTSVDVDGNGRITALELKEALKNGNNSTFDISTIEMLMKLFVCGIHFFRCLWRTICRILPELFSSQDSDRSGTITFQEFQGIFKVRRPT